MARRDLTNHKFGKLVAVEDVGVGRDHRRAWMCRCDCGAVKVVSARCLLVGYTKSCGCLKDEILRTQTENERMADGESAFNALFRDYRRQAARKNRSFELTREQFRSITSLDCFYCGRKPMREYWANSSKFSGPYIYNGIDRLNNGVGYVYDNCVPCCWRCNQNKSDLSIDEFKDWIETVYSRLFGVIKDG